MERSYPFVRPAGRTLEMAIDLTAQ